MALRVHFMKLFVKVITNAVHSPLNASSMHPGSSISPWHRATQHAQVEAVQLLLSLGALCTRCDEDGWMECLHMMSMHNARHHMIVRLSNPNLSQ